MYKVGDRFRVKSRDEEEVIVITAIFVSSGGDLLYHTLNSDGFVGSYYKETLEGFCVFIPESTIQSIKCTCGAKHTSNPNHHLPYCDIKE